jgi:hypothetical protein
MINEIEENTNKYVNEFQENISRNKKTKHGINEEFYKDAETLKNSN